MLKVAYHNSNNAWLRWIHTLILSVGKPIICILSYFNFISGHTRVCVMERCIKTYNVFYFTQHTRTYALTPSCPYSIQH